MLFHIHNLRIKPPTSCLRNPRYIALVSHHVDIVDMLFGVIYIFVYPSHSKYLLAVLFVNLENKKDIYYFLILSLTFYIFINEIHDFEIKNIL